MKYISLLIFFLSISICLQAQDDDVLFTVAGEPVELQEFKYIYEKTNQNNADYSAVSVDEYLKLYKKFKLKVKRARDMKLDTIVALQKELEGYRTQLANSYLIDKEVTEKLQQELYKRQKQDINISHILVKCAKDASPADSLAAYTKIKNIYNALLSGADFEKMAMMKSEDKTAKDNKGKIGFLTAMLPNGFYALESAAYNQVVNQIGAPVRTNLGYHIVKVNEVRKSRRQMEVAHILIRYPEKGDKSIAKTKIDSISTALDRGGDFDQIAVVLSEDKVTAPVKGYLGFFGINRYEKNFEDAAFALEIDGQVSRPFETSAGWHIVKRISKKEEKVYGLMKGELQRAIKKDQRYELAQDAMLNRIKKEANYKVNDKNLDQYLASLDEQFLSYKWKPSKAPNSTQLFSIGGKEVSVFDFEKFLGNSSRKRQRLGRSGDAVQTGKTLFNDFVKQECLAYEEGQLEKKYPEFKYLMREYEEGILLFEATKMEVWDKATQDSVGLSSYFDKLKGRGKYMWKDRAEVSFYTVKNEDVVHFDKVLKMAETKSTEEVLAKINKPDHTIVKVRTETFEKGKNKVLDAMTWKVGEISAPEKSKRDNSQNFMKIEKVMAPMEKTMAEARGYIVADYQDYLEKEWIQVLQRTYDIEVNDKVLKKIVKKKKK